MTRTLGFWVRRILPWVLRHPFILSRPSWAVGLLISVVIAVGGLVVGFLPAAFVGLLLLLAALTALGGWKRLLKKGVLPVLWVSQFRPATPGAEDASLNHQIAMSRRLTESPLVAERVEVRGLPAAIEETESERLLRASKAGRGVVRGDVQATATVGSFDAVLTYHETDASGQDEVREHQRGENQVATHHRVATDYQVQLEELVGQHFRASHADGIEGMLLVLFAEAHLEQREYAEAEKCLKAAEPFRDHMPDAGRVHFTLARTFLDYRGDLETAVKVLRSSKEEGDPELRKAAAWLSMVGLNTGEIKATNAVKECRRAVEVAEDDEPLGLWLSDALVEAKKPDEALAELDRLKAQNHLLDLDPNIMLRTGAIEYNRGNFEKAKDSYENLVATEPSARSHLYLGDALLNLDQIRAARYHYRQALLIQPDLVDALRGYWWKVPRGEQAKEDVFDKLFWFVNKRLRRLPMEPRLHLLYLLVKQHYRLHPEDARVHFMLGAHALLLKKLDVASKRLEFANDFVEGLDTEATARLVIVRLLEGRKGDAEKELIKLRTTELGHPPTPQELVDRGLDLYKPVFERPGKPLLCTEDAQWLAEKVVAIFPNLEGVKPSVPLGS